MDSNLSSHRPIDQTLPASGFVMPPSGQEPARTFHPFNPGYLHVGHRRLDRTKVWLTAAPTDSSFQQTFYNNNLDKMPEDELRCSFDWLYEFEAEHFPGSTTARQEEARRIYLNVIIFANIRANTTNTINQLRAMQDSNPLRRDSAPSHHGHGPIESAGTTAQSPIQTVLVVSASNRSNDAPSYVYLKERWTLSDLFDSLLDDCRIRGQAAETVSTIQATFLWDQRAQLLRRDRPDDWTIFWEALRRSWKHGRTFFLENGCEIEMILRVEEGA
ncbi:MAG: hypothetical protein ASARMPRED_000324 [Alectoria sarmentosa]|nr:MAG: hypothetical protein ASARMPRED_000324 [Alectoria sarmentosa]